VGSLGFFLTFYFVVKKLRAIFVFNLLNCNQKNNMKHLNKILFAVLMVMGLSSHAQDENNEWAISFGVNAVDTKTSAGNRVRNIPDRLTKPFKVKESWNILPSVSYFGVSKYVGDGFCFGVQGSINKIDKFAFWIGPRNTEVEIINPGDLMYYAADGIVKYSFMNMIKSKVIDPSLHVGGGYTFFGDNSYGTLNAGAALTLWFTDVVGLSLTTTYKNSFEDRNIIGSPNVPDSPDHFQHTAGIIFKFGGKDTDGDGIYDKRDACPKVAGLKQFKGCPDTDGDGIIDGSDDCPEVAGLAALNGCPDTDGDGIADKDDACPDVAGLAALKGCPDSDGDGVTDLSDKCPRAKGPKENAGCPWPDTDGDSVLDKDDKCPTVKGTVANNGCPEVASEELDNLKIQAKSVYFNSGTTTFKLDLGRTSLDVIAELIKGSPNTKFIVEGHTDSDGSDAYNQKLSEERANVVKQALIQRGVNGDNLEAVGFGETAPVATNATAKGKAENRRTEVKVKK
jgi:outer membrane protein OmpA-like peptidoglycan-associated protein